MLALVQKRIRLRKWRISSRLSDMPHIKLRCMKCAPLLFWGCKFIKKRAKWKFVTYYQWMCCFWMCVILLVQYILRWHRQKNIRRLWKVPDVFRLETNETPVTRMNVLSTEWTILGATAAVCLPLSTGLSAAQCCKDYCMAYSGTFMSQILSKQHSPANQCSTSELMAWRTDRKIAHTVAETDKTWQ